MRLILIGWLAAAFCVIEATETGSSFSFVRPRDVSDGRFFAPRAGTANSGSVPGPSNTTQTKRALQAEERKLAKLRESVQKQALRDQQDEQRRRDRQARDESAAQALLLYEAREAQESEERRTIVVQQQATETREAEERKIARLREREQKQALRDQQDEQRRRDGQAREHAATQAHLRRKAVAEARKAQDAENHRLRDEQRMAKQKAQEQKQLLRDEQDQRHRLDRQARDEASMQALLCHEAAANEKRAMKSKERKLARVRERELNRALLDNHPLYSDGVHEGLSESYFGCLETSPLWNQRGAVPGGRYSKCRSS